MPHNGPMFKNRIVGHGEEQPDQLLANPANWRIHPAEQQDEVESLLEAVGWIQQIVINRRTGHVVDGHLRVQLALTRSEETVPVLYIDVSEREERRILLSLDQLAAMAGRDTDKLSELLTAVKSEWGEDEINYDALFAPGKKKSKGLAHEVHPCKCCEKKCKIGCGCHRDD